MRNSTGFTLIELLVVVTIAALLAAVAVPNLSAMVAANRVQAEQRDFATALALARSEAASRGRPVVMCRSRNGSDCSGNWREGWLIFQDDNGNGGLDAGEQIIRVGGGGTTTIVVYNAEGTPLPSIGFDREGFSNVRLTVRFCGEEPRHGRAVLLERTGRTSLSQAGDDGIHRDASNHPLGCS